MLGKSVDEIREDIKSKKKSLVLDLIHFREKRRKRE